MEINFWRTKSESEVDFIFELNNEKIPLESKSNFLKTKISRSLAAFIIEYEPGFAVIANESLCEIVDMNKVRVYFLPHWII